MNLSKFRRYIIHRWDTGDGEHCERIHYSCFRGIKDKDLKRFYRDDDTFFWSYSRDGNYEQWQKVKRTDRKVRHRDR